MLLALGCLLLLVHNILFLLKNAKTDPAKVLLYFLFTAITIYVYGRLQYWVWAKPLLPFVLLLVTITLIIHLVRNKSLKTPQIILIAYTVFFMILAYTPSYKIFYFLQLNPVLNEKSRKVDFHSWDKYSWFLNLRGLKNEALEANRNAYEAAESCVELYPFDGSAKEYLKTIKQRESLIQANKWDDWDYK